MSVCVQPYPNMSAHVLISFSLFTNRRKKKRHSPLNVILSHSLMFVCEWVRCAYVCVCVLSPSLCVRISLASLERASHITSYIPLQAENSRWTERFIIVLTFCLRGSVLAALCFAIDDFVFLSTVTHINNKKKKNSSEIDKKTIQKVTKYRNCGEKTKLPRSNKGKRTNRSSYSLGFFFFLILSSAFLCVFIGIKVNDGRCWCRNTEGIPTNLTIHYYQFYKKYSETVK